ncbi:hypothetical protein SAMN05216483_0234 [Streptomyces sp. 2131.1]|uniref:hypothetical protein n=1 Tax=Streptomyces sp. 2131.1 TaxID=1855346 RepID=UPI000896ED71|nr:hypothetical protein [Streptomyces sp. 2131.1]SEB69863.1 hypothetical protein SAMN05216483_0234 [Streptomyces sp. 2131.1]
MEASELAAAAVRVMTEDGPAGSGRKTAVQELVWGRLGRSELGASALRRLHEQPGEGSAAIVASVLADDLRADGDFRARVDAALRVPPRPATSPPGATATLPAPPPPVTTPPVPDAPQPRRRAASGAVPPLPRPVTGPGQPVGSVRAVLTVWLLGLPQAVLAYTLIIVDAGHGANAALENTLLVASACLAGYALWSGARLLYRRAPNPSLRAATLLAGLVLLRLLLWLSNV